MTLNTNKWRRIFLLLQFRRKVNWKKVGKNEKYCKVKSWKTLQYFVCGEPGGIRTPDPRLRRPVLYPTELLTHNK